MNTQQALPVLSPFEARVLGCLIEKETTTPDAYPLTINAAQVAANQKTAREPLMTISHGDVNHALRTLETKGFARQVYSTRAERYEHRTGKALDLLQQQLALLGLLLLRGAQTAHELLARGERLASFSDAEDVRHHLERMIQRTPALVVQVPRGPGQREDRYVHLLGGPVDVAAVSAKIAATPSSAGPGGGASALEARVSALENELAVLRERLEALAGAASGD